MDFYYEVGSRASLKIQVLLEFCPTIKVNHCTLSALSAAERQSSLCGIYNVLLRMDSKFQLFEPLSIMRFIASQAGILYGENPSEKALVDQWLSYYNYSLSLLLNQFYDVILGHKTVTRNKYHSLNHEIKQILQQIDLRLKVNPFICGNFMSIVDISLASDLFLACRLVITDKYRKSIAYLMKWYQRITTKEQFQKVFGHDWPCKKQLVPETFLHDDQLASDNSILAQKKEISIVTLPVIQSEQSLVMHTEQTATNKRNQLAYSYFKQIVIDNQQKKVKLDLMWNVFDMFQCSIWKVQNPKPLTIQKDQDASAVLLDFLERLKPNLTEDDFGWHGVYTDGQKYDLRGVWCISNKQKASWMKGNPLLEGFQIVGLLPEKEADRGIIEDHWCNTKPGQTCCQERTVYCSILLH